MVEKGIRGRLCYSISRYAKVDNEYLKDYDKNGQLSNLKYWDVNSLHGSEMSQKLPINGFQLVEETSDFNEDFMKSYNEESELKYFLEVDVQYPENLFDLHNQTWMGRACNGTHNPPHTPY